MRETTQLRITIVSAAGAVASLIAAIIALGGQVQLRSENEQLKKSLEQGLKEAEAQAADMLQESVDEFSTRLADQNKQLSVAARDAMERALETVNEQVTTLAQEAVQAQFSSTEDAFQQSLSRRTSEALASAEAVIEREFTQAQEEAVVRVNEVIEGQLKEHREAKLQLEVELVKAGYKQEAAELKNELRRAQYPEAKRALSRAASVAFERLCAPGAWMPMQGRGGLSRKALYPNGVAQPHSLSAIQNVGALTDSRPGALTLYSILSYRNTDHVGPWMQDVIPLKYHGTTGNVEWDQGKVSKALSENSEAKAALSAVEELAAFLRDWGPEAVVAGDLRQ